MKCNRIDCLHCTLPVCLEDIESREDRRALRKLQAANKPKKPRIKRKRTEIDRQYGRTYYHENAERINFFARVRRKIQKVRAITECAECHKEFDPSIPRTLLKYDKKYFCCEECVKDYMLEKFDNEIEEEFIDTEESIRNLAMEEWGQAQREKYECESET